MNKKIALMSVLSALSITSVSAAEKLSTNENIVCEQWKVGAEYAMTSRQVRGLNEKNTYINIVDLFEGTPLVQLERAPKYLVRMAYQEPIHKGLRKKQYAVNKFAAEQYEYCLSASEEAKDR